MGKDLLYLLILVFHFPLWRHALSSPVISGLPFLPALVCSSENLSAFLCWQWLHFLNLILKFFYWNRFLDYFLSTKILLNCLMTWMFRQEFISFYVNKVSLSWSIFKFCFFFSIASFLQFGNYIYSAWRPLCFFFLLVYRFVKFG